MAARNSKDKHEIAPGVTIDFYSWGYIYRGRDEDLISAQIIDSECIPGKPGQRKTVAYIERCGKTIRVRRSSKRRLEVWEECSEHDASADNVIDLAAYRWDLYIARIAGGASHG